MLEAPLPILDGILVSRASGCVELLHTAMAGGHPNPYLASYTCHCSVQGTVPGAISS